MKDHSDSHKEDRDLCQQLPPKDRSFLHLVKVNQEVNLTISQSQTRIPWLTSWLTLTRCKKDRTSVPMLLYERPNVRRGRKVGTIICCPCFFRCAFSGINCGTIYLLDMCCSAQSMVTSDCLETVTLVCLELKCPHRMTYLPHTGADDI